jgi:hypothetical protein
LIYSKGRKWKGRCFVSHCVVCSSSIYGFWLPLWYLQTLLTSKCIFITGSKDPNTKLWLERRK